MPTEVYRLPDFLVLLSKKTGSKISPHFKEVGTAFNAWVEQKLGGPFAVAVRKCDNPLFSALICPLASSRQLRGIIDYTAAGFLIDDLIDRSPIDDVPALSELWIDILRNGSEAKSVERFVIGKMLSELLLTTKASMDHFHWHQFIAESTEMVMYMAQEARERNVYLNKNTTLDLQSHMIKRRVNVGAGPFFVFARCTRCLSIPDSVLANPVVQEMEKATTDMLIIPNDVYSFKREYSFDGGFSNILTVIQKDPETAHLDFQERLNYAEKLFKTALERFHACMQELPSFGPEVDQSLALYADGLIDLVVGNVEWSRVVPRYDAFSNEEDRRNNVLRLALDSSPAN